MNCPRCNKPYQDTNSTCPFCRSKHPRQFPGIRHVYTKVAGVTQKNSDGKTRQAIIKRIARTWGVGHLRIQKYGRDAIQLILDEEPDNPVDPHAIKVCMEDGVQIGYLSRELAAHVAARNAQGCKYMTVLDNITERHEDNTVGVNLLIIEAEPAAESNVGAFFEEYFKPRR